MDARREHEKEVTFNSIRPVCGPAPYPSVDKSAPGRTRSVHCKDWARGDTGASLRRVSPLPGHLAAAESVAACSLLIDRRGAPGRGELLRAENAAQPWRKSRSIASNSNHQLPTPKVSGGESRRDFHPAGLRFGLGEGLFGSWRLTGCHPLNAWSMGKASPDHARAAVHGCGAADQNSSPGGRPSGSSPTAHKYKLPVEMYVSPTPGW